VVGFGLANVLLAVLIEAMIRAQEEQKGVQGVPQEVWAMARQAGQRLARPLLHMTDRSLRNRLQKRRAGLPSQKALESTVGGGWRVAAAVVWVRWAVGQWWCWW
jgi:hypothetical protein